ncbi:serine/threonine-protein kinase pim-2-like [Carassius auratus]|uniref:non-specific serine/threonine protein kinase n=1 Tax=Carassius auratus TaxID=7957 RepID=A0A6P6N7H0_CARAU|nr:serine/threonine-protein kinase pim-2-like [Carassius auratus]
MEKGKKKKKWWRLSSLFGAVKKHLKRSSNPVQGEVELQQEQEQSEGVKNQNQCKDRCSDDYTVRHNLVSDQLCEGGFDAEATRLKDDPELGSPQRLPEEKDLNILSTADAAEGNDQERKVMEKEKKKKKWNQKEQKARCSDDFISSHYQLGDLLGEGGFGSVYEARRLEDDLKVAVKYVNKTETYRPSLYIPGYQQHVPLEIALTILANKGPRVPEIIQLLDWKDYSDHFVMILECPSPCETLEDFVGRQGGRLNESLARRVMMQVTKAANVCCQRQVFHRDIKLSNLLINNQTLEVKLIDFGCGDILRTTVYMSYSGTATYVPPEFHIKGKYHGKPATVWSLGVLLFKIVAGYYPGFLDLHMLKLHLWSTTGLSNECCRLLRALLQIKPKNRIQLEEILSHKWFTVLNATT